MAIYKSYSEGATYRLTDYGGQRYTDHPEIEPDHEKQIQQNIQRRGCHDKIKRMARIIQSAQSRAQRIVDIDKNQSAHADKCVVPGEIPSFNRSVEPA